MVSPSCPFCNALLDSPRWEGNRWLCPRCGEPLPEQLAAKLPSPATVQEADPSWGGGELSNRGIAMGVLGVMLFMGVVGLVYALWTVDFRRGNDLKNAPPEPFRAASPADLPALGYLPVQTSVVVAFYLSQLLEDPSGKKLLEPPTPALLDAVLSHIKEWTSLEPADLDHLAIGLTLTGTMPRVFAVLRTRGAFDPGGLPDSLKRAGQARHRQRPLYRFQVQPIGQGLLWLADDYTVIVMLGLDATVEDLETVPLPPRKNLEGWPEPLQQAIRQRLDKRSLAWAAGHLDKVEAFAPLLALLPKAPEGASLLAKARSFAIGLTLDEQATLLGQFQLVDDASRRAWQSYLENLKIPGSLAQRVAGPPAEAKDVDAHWITWQIRGDIAGFRQALSLQKP